MTKIEVMHKKVHFPLKPPTKLNGYEKGRKRKTRDVRKTREEAESRKKIGKLEENEKQKGKADCNNPKHAAPGAGR